MRLFRLNHHRPYWTALLLVLAGVLSGCGSSDDDGGGNRGGAPEMTKVTVGALPIVDSASLYIAMKKGYFADEGLQVEVKSLASGAFAVPGLANDELQFAMGNYVSFFSAQAAGELDLKLVADAYQAASGMFLIMVAGDSKITKARDLARKRIAVNALGNVAELTARSALATAGVDLNTVTFEQLPFGEMTGAINTGSVDAAFMVEPYVTQSQKDAGAIPVVDAASGATAEIPIAGWVTSAKTANEHPNTVRAFQRAIIRGQADAADRVEVESVLGEYVKVDAMTISLMTLGVWPTTLEATRIERVVDLMSSSGQLRKEIDVRAMIIPPPAD